MKKVYILTEEEIIHIKKILEDMKCDIWDISDNYVRYIMMAHYNSLEEIIEDI